ncbi:TetR/AcrR family transcriptional regulator [Notoacmeibacter ruber]|nr:TetR/AcrR family transcriptional regulator [Notoacmeibacter ruber]
MNFFQSCRYRRGETRQSSRAENRELQTARILQAAAACFVRSGFQGASMHEICREAGMSPGALYRYFPSKEAIIEAIVEEVRKRDAEFLSEMANSDDVVEGLVKAFYNHLRSAEETGLRPLFIEIRAEAMRNKAVHETCQLVEGVVRESFRSYLSAAKDDGLIDPVVSLDALMTVLMSIGEGFLIADLPGHELSRDEIKQALTDTISAVVRPTTRSREPSLVCIDGKV